MLVSTSRWSAGKERAKRTVIGAGPLSGNRREREERKQGAHGDRHGDGQRDQPPRLRSENGLRDTTSGPAVLMHRRCWVHVSPFTQARTRHAEHGTRSTADGTRRAVCVRGHTQEREHVTIGPRGWFTLALYIYTRIYTPLSGLSVSPDDSSSVAHGFLARRR